MATLFDRLVGNNLVEGSSKLSLTGFLHGVLLVIDGRYTEAQFRTAFTINDSSYDAHWTYFKSGYDVAKAAGKTLLFHARIQALLELAESKLGGLDTLSVFQGQFDFYVANVTSLD